MLCSNVRDKPPFVRSSVRPFVRAFVCSISCVRFRSFDFGRLISFV